MTLRDLHRYRQQLRGQCRRKYRHQTEADAKQAARNLRIYYYKCPHCHKYHLTRVPQ